MRLNRLAFQSEYVRIEDGDYDAALMVSMNKLSDTKLSRVIRWAGEADIDMQFMLVARIVPLSMDDTVELLRDACQCFREGGEVLSVEGQSRMAMVVRALLERADDYVHGGALLGAACVCIAIVQSLEESLSSVDGDGALLRQLVSDTFAMLREMIMEPADKQEFSLIGLLAEAQFNGGVNGGSAVGDRRIFAADWEDVIGQYKRHVARFK